MSLNSLNSLKPGLNRVPKQRTQTARVRAAHRIVPHIIFRQLIFGEGNERTMAAGVGGRVATSGYPHALHTA